MSGKGSKCPLQKTTVTKASSKREVSVYPLLNPNLAKFLTVEDHTEGYPQLAAYHSADPNFRIYRRFGTVRNRLILYKQWKITLLERELARLDVEDDILDNKRAMSIETDEQEHESRRSVALEKLDAALKQYGETQYRG